MSSDHSPIYLTICRNILEKQTKPTLLNKLDDWNYFKHVLNTENTSGTPSHIEQLEKQILEITK